MFRLLTNGILIAQQNRLDSLSRGFKGRRTQINMDDVVIGLVIVLCIAVAIWLLGRLTNVLDKRTSFRGPRRLFLSLCKAHRLRWTDRWLLWRLAAAQKLREPARLFLEPKLFDPARLSTLTPARASQLIELRNTLFAESDEPGDPPPRAGDPPLEPFEFPVAQRPAGAPVGPPPAEPTGERPALDIPPWTPPVQS